MFSLASCSCGCGLPAPIATQTNTKAGHVKGEPMRFVLGHAARRSPVDWIEDPDTGCWVWQHSLGTRGYGQKWVDGSRIILWAAFGSE